MLIFDIETDGLVHDVSSIHCAVIYDTENDSYAQYNDSGTQDPIIRAITRLEEADRIVGHNIINYDLRVIAKLYPFFLLSVMLSILFFYLDSTIPTLWR